MKKAVGSLAALLVMVSSVSAHAAENAKILGDANGGGVNAPGEAAEREEMLTAAFEFGQSL